METKQKTLILIDGNSILYRAFHAIPVTLTNGAGLVTNAVFGFTQSLRKIIADFSPDYIGVAFDLKGPTFRHEKFAEYKADRKPMPDALIPQIPYIKQMVRAFKIPVIESPGFEADDLIATAVGKAAKDGLKTLIVTGDKDMYQLVNGNTRILDYITGKEYGVDDVKEKFGVPPELIRDLLGLAGDSSDGIPGVSGVGAKTAEKLLTEFGNLDNLFVNIEQVSSAKLREGLISQKDTALFSRELATLHAEAPLEWDLAGLELKGPDVPALASLLKELGFSKLLKEVLAGEGRSERQAYGRKVVDTAGEAELLLKEIKGKGLSLFLEFADDDVVSGTLIGLGVAVSNDKAFFAAPNEAGLILQKALPDEGVKKETDNAKSVFAYALRNDIEVRGEVFDIGLASYLVDPSKPGHGIDKLALEYLDRTASKPSKTNPIGLFNSADTALVQENALNIKLLSDILKPRLEQSGLSELYREMELPLSEVLASMELHGIKVDLDLLALLSREIELKLSAIERDIYRAAGHEFNINSPKQLSELLFTRLGLRPVKKTKTGFSTDEEVLSMLAASHEIPQMIVSFRQLSKLKSTYIDALPKLVNQTTGRIHTSFNQTITATGRLSSSRPNLQNIPQRGDYATRIREAFVPESGFFFLSADYSQIELRIMAHMSDDPALIDAFNKDHDIHARTAAEVFGVKDLRLITPEMRHRAKAINFGIIYGMGAYGLASALSISQEEAAGYIDLYFSRYPGVKGFMDRAVKDAARLGYTTTLFNRRRFIPELKSQTDSVMRLGARLAVNTPIQGTAADMLKAAMIKIYHRLKAGRAASRMLLQIHDELVVEVSDAEKAEVTETVKAGMQDVLSLKVPIKVNIKTGPNWSMVE